MIHFTCCSSPFGPLRIGCEDEYVVSIRLGSEETVDSASPLSDQVAAQLRAYFAGSRKDFDLPIKPKGTPFQLAVWQEMLRIPYGEVRTYGQIAAAIGKPKAARAVGQAANRNPIWILIPCHRVVGSNQALTGYAGGLSMKRALLELEQAK